MFQLSVGMLLTLIIGYSISTTTCVNVSRFRDFRKLGCRRLCVHVHSHLAYLGEDTAVYMLLNSSLCVQHTVRPNNPEHWSLEHRKFYCRAKQEE